MAVLKNSTSRLTADFRIKDYLESKAIRLRDGTVRSKERALARDFRGIPPSQRDDWARYMDRTRNRLLGVCSPGDYVTYHHYIVSPDPRDRIDLARLRDLACAWVDMTFPTHQVAIVYHDDNDRHIPHAHIIVNNVDLETRRRIKISDAQYQGNFRKLQKQARERDLSETTLKADRPREKRVPERTDRRSFSKEEKAILREGKWTVRDELASVLNIARGVATTPAQFVRIVRAYGIDVRQKNGEYLFRTRRTGKGGKAKEYTMYGKTLGAGYSRRMIHERIERNARREQSSVERAVSIGVEENGPKIVRLGTVSSSVTVHDLSNFLDTCQAFSAYTLEDIKKREKDVGVRIARAREQGSGDAKNKANLRDLRYKYARLKEAEAIFESGDITGMAEYARAAEERSAHDAFDRSAARPGRATSGSAAASESAPDAPSQAHGMDAPEHARERGQRPPAR